MENVSYETLAVLLLFNAIVVLASFVFASSAIFAAFRNLVTTPIGRSVAWAASLTVGPTFLSWVLTMLLYFAPGRDRYFYLGLVAIIVILPGIIFIRGFFSNAVDGLVEHLRGFKLKPLRAIFTALFVLFLAFTLGQLVLAHLVIPINANDPLEYATVARIIFENASAVEYPYSEPAFTGGVQASWTHPLGYVNLLTFGYLIQGHAEFAGVIRMVAPWFAFSLSILVYVVAGYRRPLAGAIAALMVVTTPYFFQLAIQAHIDIMRLATFFTSFAAVWLLAREENWRCAILAGLCAGACHFVHSIGLITLPLILPLYFLVSKANWKVTWRNIITIAGIAVSTVFLRIYINFAEFGTLIKDGPIIWSFDHLHVQAHREVIRLLYTTYDKIISGVFAGWSQQQLFGWTYWIGTIALMGAIYAFRSELKQPMALFSNRSWRLEDPILAAIILCGGYFALVFLTLVVGTDLAIKNARYLLTIHPLIVLVTARLVAWPLDAGEGLKLKIATSREEAQGV